MFCSLLIWQQHDKTVKVDVERIYYFTLTSVKCKDLLQNITKKDILKFNVKLFHNNMLNFVICIAT